MRAQVREHPVQAAQSRLWILLHNARRGEVRCHNRRPPIEKEDTTSSAGVDGDGHHRAAGPL